MHRAIVIVLLGLVLGACGQMRAADRRLFDREGAYFSSLFGERSGTCEDLRRALKAEIDEIKSAQKKADDDFIAEQTAPAPQNSPPPRGSARGSEMAPLREIAKKTRHAEEMNSVLRQRRCRTMNIEEAQK